MASKVYPPPANVASTAHVQSFEEYERLYAQSVENPEKFWSELAARDFYWEKPWTETLAYNFDMTKGPIYVRWFAGGLTNACWNAVDRHLEDKGDQVAFFWEGNDVGEEKIITYRELHSEVCKFANVLKSYGVEKGDTIAFYLPMIPELVVGVLACARLGAIHSVVFGGFSAESLANRMVDCRCKVLVTADGVMRGPKLINLKKEADSAMTICEKEGFTCKNVVVYQRLGEKKVKVDMFLERDSWWHDAMARASPECPVEWVDAEHPLFMLYTSGSTGKPKGVVHTTGGYMVYAATTHKYVFDYHPGDVYFCTADIGWVTGHSYCVYGPLCNGATSVLFEGVPNHPDAGRFWDIVDKYQVTQFYTAPTAVRALMRYGESYVVAHKRTSLRILGTVGEPINPEAWNWYNNVIGDGRCPIVDTWWQTETGGHLITPLPGATPLKPGSATRPFFGVVPALLSDKGEELPGAASGYLVLTKPWPGIMRTVYKDHARFESTYFGPYKGYYFTGDGANRDEDGYYWLTGRVDDVMNVSGHRLGTAEVESALVSHPSIAEAAVVPFPHDIKGEGIYAFVTPKEGVEQSDKLKQELIAQVRKALGAIATPDCIHWAPGLPKTRSGKIMRRILRKIASNDLDSLGDTSTLAEPHVVEVLISLRGK